MQKFLNKSFTIRQIIKIILYTTSFLAVLYIWLYFRHGFVTQFGGIGYRASPYAELIPSECRRSAAFSGEMSMRNISKISLPKSIKNEIILDALFLRPTGYVYSLPQAEEKLGFGMNGLPCMGYDFLIRLHGDSFARKDRYINERGEVVATVTTEILRPYRRPLPAESWINPWPEITNKSIRDSSLPMPELKN